MPVKNEKVAAAMKMIQAKTILVRNKRPESWFNTKYSMNLYRGCQHGCIYCDSRSKCYGIEDFAKIQIKANAIELLTKELKGKREKCVIGTGSMSDPYNPLEGALGLTRQALQVIRRYGFSAHVTTKSDLVARDTALLASIPKATVAFTITTCDQILAAGVEPGAPSPFRRLRAMRKLADAGVMVGVLMMPILPWLEDSEENIRDIISRAHLYGASFVVPWFGMSLRDQQRDHYFRSLDRLYPGLSNRYRALYGNSYACSSPFANRLETLFAAECRARGLIGSMEALTEHLSGGRKVQHSLFEEDEPHGKDGDPL
ncbi:MAG: SPL family radical SAM protein [Solirubrobacterales bacterium]